jgi:hypothetical protein
MKAKDNATTRLQELVKELELLREYDNLDAQTLNVVLWIASEHLICEESYNLGMKLKDRKLVNSARF